MKLKRYAFLCIAAVGLSIGLIAALHHPVLAAAKDEICAGVGAATGTGGCTSKDGPSVNSIISTVVNILSMLVGLVAVIMIIFSGFRYVTSGGDSGKITSAKNTLIYAVVGLVVAGTAQIVVRFVLSNI